MPADWASYIGTYKSNVTGAVVIVSNPINNNRNINNNNNNNNNNNMEVVVLLFSYADTQLAWLGGTTFRLAPHPGDTESCFTRQIGDEYQLVRFMQGKDGVVTGFTMDIEWGQEFLRV